MTGWIYIMGRAGASEIKIGCTLSVDKTPQQRAKELSTTAVPTPFEVLHAYQIDLPEQTEKAVHRQLNQFRITPNREFFNCDVDTALSAIKQQIGDVKSQAEIAEQRRRVREAERSREEAERKHQREEQAKATTERARQREVESRNRTQEIQNDRKLSDRYHELQEVKEQKYIGWALWAGGFAYPGIWVAALAYTVWQFDHNAKNYKPKMAAIDAEASRKRAEAEKKRRDQAEAERVEMEKKQREKDLHLQTEYLKSENLRVVVPECYEGITPETPAILEANENARRMLASRRPERSKEVLLVVVALVMVVGVVGFLATSLGPVPTISTTPLMSTSEPSVEVVAPAYNQAPIGIEDDEALLLYMKKNRDLKYVLFRDQHRINPFWSDPNEEQAQIEQQAPVASIAKPNALSNEQSTFTDAELLSRVDTTTSIIFTATQQEKKVDKYSDDQGNLLIDSDIIDSENVESEYSSDTLVELTAGIGKLEGGAEVQWVEKVVPVPKNYNEIIGEWAGSYVCGEDIRTDVEFSISDDNGVGLQLEFIFRPKGTSQEGRFVLTGSVDETGNFSFRPLKWIHRLPDYAMVSLSGQHFVEENRLSGKIEYPRCKGFKVYRN